MSGCFAIALFKRYGNVVQVRSLKLTLGLFRSCFLISVLVDDPMMRLAKATVLVLYICLDVLLFLIKLYCCRSEPLNS